MNARTGNISDFVLDDESNDVNYIPLPDDYDTDICEQRVSQDTKPQKTNGGF